MYLIQYAPNESKKKRVTSHKEGENDRFFNGGNTQNSNDKEEEAFLRENARQTI